MAEFSEMTVGYDFQGAFRYLESLNAEMISETSRNIEDWMPDVINVIQECWVGQSQVNFVGKFKAASRELQSHLLEMKKELEYMMGAIEEEMIQRDKNIVDEYVGE